jgi:molecular chaperone DnaK
MPQIEVSFDIDANGIVNVQAKDLGTGKEQKITITASSGLSKDEVDRMMREAEVHAEEDKSRRELVDARNQADSLSYSVEKTLTENRDKLGAADVSRIEGSLEGLKKTIQGEDVAAIRKATEDLQKASHAMADVLYRQTQAAQQAAGSGSQAGPTAAGPGADTPPGTGDVIDAEVVDEGKK